MDDQTAQTKQTVEVNLEDLEILRDMRLRHPWASAKQQAAIERLEDAIPEPVWNPPPKLVDDLLAVADERGWSSTRAGAIDFARLMHKRGWSWGWIHPDYGEPMDDVPDWAKNPTDFKSDPGDIQIKDNVLSSVPTCPVCGERSEGQHTKNIPCACSNKHHYRCERTYYPCGHVIRWDDDEARADEAGDTYGTTCPGCGYGLRVWWDRHTMLWDPLT